MAYIRFFHAFERVRYLRGIGKPAYVRCNQVQQFLQLVVFAYVVPVPYVAYVGFGEQIFQEIRFLRLIAELEDLRISHADADLQLSPTFDPQVYDYVLTLPYEYRDELPKFIAIEKSGQTIESEHQPESADDSYSVTVLAENGTSAKTYTVKLMLMPSDIVTLDMIYADGAEIDGFDPQVAYYEIELPYGTENCPIISWDLTEPGSETAEAAYSETSDGWSVSITVTAASGDVNEYVLHFIIGKDAENRLASFKVSGKPVAGFDPDETQYTVTYPAYTDSSVLPVVDDITYELMHPGTSTATVIQSDANTIVIQVTAANGEVRNYVLETVIEISDNTGLEALYVDGELVDGFVPEIDEYYYSLPFGSTFVDETIVTYQAAESGQTVTLYKDGMDVKVSVTAQDGSSMRVYTIHFVSSSFDPSKQATLEDVCVTSTADGYWKFTTKCNNVYVCLADLSGRPIANVMLPLVDPNVPDICSPSAEGYLYVPQSSEVFKIPVVHTIFPQGFIRGFRPINPCVFYGRYFELIIRPAIVCDRCADVFPLSKINSFACRHSR